MLAAARNTLRPYLSLKTEYTVRRLAYQCLPLAYRSVHPQIVHACLWKTASQWVRLILSDPRVYRVGGHLPYVTSHVRDSNAQRRTIAQAPRRALLACYEPFEVARELAGGVPLRTALVVRDPREMLVSWYFSTRYSHDPTENVLRRRAEMEHMNDVDGLVYAAGEFAKEFPPIIYSWMGAPANDLKLVRFEDLTGRDSLAAWSDLMNFYDISISEASLAAVLNTYSINTLKKTKARSGRTAKYDNAGRARARDFDDPQIWAEFSRATGDLAEKMGYA